METTCLFARNQNTHIISNYYRLSDNTAKPHRIRITLSADLLIRSLARVICFATPSRHAAPFCRGELTPLHCASIRCKNGCRVPTQPSTFCTKYYWCWLQQDSSYHLNSNVYQGTGINPSFLTDKKIFNIQQNIQLLF